eukprot:833793-Pyramimonas_sp.AAC.1
MDDARSWSTIDPGTCALANRSAPAHKQSKDESSSRDNLKYSTRTSPQVPELSSRLDVRNAFAKKGVSKTTGAVGWNSKNSAWKSSAVRSGRGSGCCNCWSVASVPGTSPGD